MHTIKKGALLTEEQEREVNAALALEGKTRKDYATEKKVSYQRLNRMVRGDEVVTPSYAKLLNELVQRRLGARLAHAA